MPSIFITGAASGIGRATAQRFAAEGWRLGLADVDAGALDRVRAELASAELHLYALDVCDDQALAAALQDFCADQGLDVLHNNAGILRVGSFHEIALAEHRRLLEINVIGVLQTAWLAYPYLRQNQGLLINMSSASAIFGTPDFASYSASKFAVRGLTEALASEWAAVGIRVCDLMPPFVRTQMLHDESSNSRMIDRLGIHLEAPDVAEQVWCLTQERHLHNPMTLPFKVLATLSRWLPDTANRRIMQLLSRP